MTISCSLLGKNTPSGHESSTPGVGDSNNSTPSSTPSSAAVPSRKGVANHTQEEASAGQRTNHSHRTDQSSGHSVNVTPFITTQPTSKVNSEVTGGVTGCVASSFSTPSNRAQISSDTQISSECSMKWWVTLSAQKLSVCLHKMVWYGVCA